MGWCLLRIGKLTSMPGWIVLGITCLLRNDTSGGEAVEVRSAVEIRRDGIQEGGIGGVL